MSITTFSGSSRQSRQVAWRAVLVPGPGAALIASIVTSTMLMRPSVAGGNAGPRIPCTASCQGLPRIMLVATNNGSDVARFREDNDLSPPMALTRTPQEVRFPRAAPRIRLGRGDGHHRRQRHKCRDQKPADRRSKGLFDGDRRHDAQDELGRSQSLAGCALKASLTGLAEGQVDAAAAEQDMLAAGQWRDAVEDQPRRSAPHHDVPMFKAIARGLVAAHGSAP